MNVSQQKYEIPTSHVCMPCVLTWVVGVPLSMALVFWLGATLWPIARALWS